MAVVTFGTLFGPALGPVVGGYIGAARGWRSIFWVLSIVTAITSIPTLFLKETYGPVIARRLLKRQLKHKTTPDPTSSLDEEQRWLRTALEVLSASARALRLSPSLFFVSIFIAVTNAYLMILLTTFNTVFEQQYGFSLEQVGLSYLALGIGGGIGIILTGCLSDLTVTRSSRNNQGVRPEIRLVPATIYAIVMPAGLFMYGWTAERETHWFSTAVGAAIFSFGCLGSQVAVRSYIVDTYLSSSSSALAANLILRSIFTALLPLAGRSLYGSLGLGWGNSLLGFSTLLLLPIPLTIHWRST